jgi:hypothetical protein
MHVTYSHNPQSSRRFNSGKLGRQNCEGPGTRVSINCRCTHGRIFAKNDPVYVLISHSILGSSTRQAPSRKMRKEKGYFFTASVFFDVQYNVWLIKTHTSIQIAALLNLHRVIEYSSSSSCRYSYRSLAGLDSFDSFSVVWSPKNCRTSNNGIRPSFNDLVGILRTNTTINLNPGVYSLLCT